MASDVAHALGIDCDAAEKRLERLAAKGLIEGKRLRSSRRVTEMCEPVRVGCARDVVAEIRLDRPGLEWLAGLCPDSDGFTKEIYTALAELDERERIRQALPGLELRVLDQGAVGEGR